MDTFLNELTLALAEYINTVTGVRPQKRQFKLSRTGALSLNAFVTMDASLVSSALSARLNECVLWGICPIKNVYCENGWLLFTLSHAFYRILCEKAAALDREPGTDYVSLRLKLAARKQPTPCPDDFQVHSVLLRSVFAEDKGYFTKEDDTAVLSMTHSKKGRARLELENNCGTVARALLMLRAPDCSPRT